MGVQMVKANSKVPIYSAWEFMMEYGILGGKMIHGYDHGVQAGQMGLRVLEGEAPENITVIHHTPSRYIFDYQELKRFGIPIKEIPVGSSILKLPSSIYTIPKNITYILVSGVILVLSIIISMLLRYIKKLRETKKALRESEEQLRNLINAMPDFVCFKDGEGHWMEVNHACQEIFGLEGIAYKGKRDQDLAESAEFCRGALLTCEKTDELAWENQSITWAEEMIPGKDETEKIFDVCKVPLFKEDGSRKGIVILGRDITKRKRDSERIQQLKEEVEHDKLRTEFFANLSHELRTPLNLILGTVQLLEMNLRNSEMTDKEPHTLRRMKIVKQNCFRLLRLINNLIDITKVDAGFLELEQEHHNIVNIIEEITLSVAEYTEQQNLNLQFDTEIEEKIMLCDPDKIERIMLNLLSNAIKFSKPGGDILVNVYEREDRILISVKDTGIGIHADKLALVFERFRQVDKSFTRNHEGSGIGLSLVKSLIELHGGRITLESEYGQGSEFLIELPVTNKDGMALDHQRRIPLQSRVERIHIEFSDIYG
jgi:PAS domain S-box-containing protein